MKTRRTPSFLFAAFVGACASTVSAQTYQFSTIYTFTGHADGFQPDGDMTIDANGNLYAETAASRRRRTTPWSRPTKTVRRGHGQ